MLTLSKNKLVALICGLFIATNCILFTYDIYWFALLPVLLLIGWFIFYRTTAALLITAFLTPFSQQIDFDFVHASLNLPTEPMMMILTFLFWLKLIIGGKYDMRVFRHPITLAIIFNVSWMLVTATTSSMPFVSFKFLIARIWFITTFYLIAIPVFKEYKNIKAFIWMFVISLTAVIFYSLYRHSLYHFSQDYSTHAPKPFFSDHGIYAAVIALFIPAMALFFFKRKAFKLSLWQAGFALFFFTVLLTGLVFSFTRAAWLGVGAATGFAAIVIFKIQFRTILAGLALVAIFIWLHETDLYFELKSNKRVSASNFEQHIESMTNISTDVSNIERINRWHSAWRMFQVKPIFGWGPGTYMFQYGPFQLSREMTIISVRNGSLGNAHSEFLGPMAESGVFGILSVITLFVTSIVLGMRLMYKSRSQLVKYTAMAAILGLITYYVHGVLNDYLDLDKAAIPFWALMAIITALDLYYNKSGSDSEAEQIAANAVDENYQV